MKTLELSSGQSIEVDENFEVLDENFIKVNLSVDGTDIEGIWAVLPKQFKEEYDKNTKSDNFAAYASLRNCALSTPFNSWGMIIPIKFNGESRPICHLNWFKEGSEIIYHTDSEVN